MLPRTLKQALTTSLVFLLTLAAARAQQDIPAKTPVIQTTSTLVFLDITVLDKQGNPVTHGLTKDDFTITEDKKSQRVFSFEEPATHETAQAPKTVLVLDLLNTPFEDFVYVREQAQKFLQSQPETLKQETELMLVGNSTFELLQGFTSSRADLLSTLEHMPTVMPFKADEITFRAERIRQSYIALQQIAVQNRGLPGRKNVIWIGTGAPDLQSADVPDAIWDKVQQYVRRTVNMMVEARLSLFLIYPKIKQGFSTSRKAGGQALTSMKASSYSDFLTATEPADALSKSGFTSFAYQTGGKVFEQNDVSTEIADSEELGANYYTLTYQPREDKANGDFRKIQVKLKDPSLHALTKTGFFSRERKETVSPDDKILNMLTEASLAIIPLKALNVTLSGLQRHPSAHTVDITVALDDPKLGWQSVQKGYSATTVILEAVMLSGHQDMLASRVAKYELLAKSQDAAKLATVKPTVKVTLRMPSSTKNLRVAVSTYDGSRIGALELTRKQLDDSPETP